MTGTLFRLWRVGDGALRQLPLATDSQKIAAQALLLRPLTAAYYTSPNLLSLLIFKCIDLTLAHGVTPVSAWALSSLAFVRSWVLGQPARGAALGEAAREMGRQAGSRVFAGRVELNVLGFIDAMERPVAETGPGYTRLAQSCLAAGDWEYAVICSSNSVVYGLNAGAELGALAVRAAEVTDVAMRIAQPRWLLAVRYFAQVVESLRGRSPPAGDVSGSVIQFEEVEEKGRTLEDPAFMIQLHSTRCFVRAHLGEFAAAVESARECDAAIGGQYGSPHVVMHHALGGIARAWEARFASGNERKALLAAAHASRKVMKDWAKRSPQNCGHLVDCLDGVLDAAAGRWDSAFGKLESATKRAVANDFVQDGGLAMQLAGRLEHERGRTRAAAAYFNEAVALYTRWGAWAVIDRLGAFGAVPVSPDSRHDSDPDLSPADLALIRAAQAVSKETSVDALLERIVTVVAELVGARRAVLATLQAGELRVIATAATTESGLKVTIASRTPGGSLVTVVPGAEAAMAFVARTGEAVLSADAREEPRLGRAVGNTARSLLAVPLRKGDEILGVIYVDNDALPGAFRPAHQELVVVLAAQAAVALENALLVEELRVSVAAQRALAASFQRFVPRQFLEQLRKKSILEVMPGDQVSGEFTVMFADVRGFTTIAERLKEVKTFAFINRYLAYVQPAVENNGGFINQYLGDGIMCLFPSADQAVAGAVGMFEGVARYNEERGDLPEIKIGAGLNTGPLVLGTLGVEGRLDCGVIGDAVNLAARVEGMTKAYGAPLVLSDSTFVALKHPELWHLRPLDLVIPVGRKQPLRIHEVLDVEIDGVREAKIASRIQYSSALEHYFAGRFDAALGGFSGCVAACPGDRAARLMAQRTAELRDDGPPEGWDGAYRLRTK